MKLCGVEMELRAPSVFTVRFLGPVQKVPELLVGARRRRRRALRLQQVGVHGGVSSARNLGNFRRKDRTLEW